MTCGARSPKATPDHLPDLARALTNLGSHLHLLDRPEEELAAREEALSIRRDLARREPDRYQETYQRERARLRRDLSLHGKEPASTRLHLDDDNPGTAAADSES